MPRALPRPIDRLHERLFVAGYAAVQRGSEAAGMREIRRRLVASAGGTVLEIGAGTGLNLPHYGSGVGELTLVEPAPAMRDALRRVAADDGRVRIVDGTGERLPGADGSVDVVVATFALCSVEDPPAVLREAARVLRPGGTYLGLEHVAGEGTIAPRARRLVAPVWRFAARGCRCDQDAAGLLRASPLALEVAEPFRGPRQPWPVRPGVRLVARRV
ncbi:class I SAM-dependent methyltransferase [Patulibacter minatonensis]|uniref:class I SAM-dependent methyltransferase n=1 Tax=Patulibacter minatonensis TaxID=298163 RepID=UPI0006852B86|nr:class I SAM-dependent methyltransferase [Patulibacter minatonensis]